MNSEGVSGALGISLGNKFEKTFYTFPTHTWEKMEVDVFMSFPMAVSVYAGLPTFQVGVFTNTFKACRYILTRQDVKFANYKSFKIIKEYVLKKDPYFKVHGSIEKKARKTT